VEAGGHIAGRSFDACVGAASSRCSGATHRCCCRWYCRRSRRLR
jgi:hypothetical protein